MNRHAVQGRDFVILSQPDQPMVVVIPNQEANPGNDRFWRLRGLPAVLAELREQFPDKKWEAPTTDEFREIDTGSGPKVYRATQFIVVSYD